MKRLKAGKRGEATKYISRAKAIRKLQISLKDFRKLCILKGVYPRQPPKKLKKHNRTYYHQKDINFMALDPIIARIRSQKVYMKKYKKAKVKNDIGKIRYLVANKPKLSLNHLVRQRYPDFIDALRDLDDPLSLMALFSIFPTHKQFNLSSEKIQMSTKLLKYFELYIIKSHSLQKVFVSIKGIYYQAEVMGQKITYITPYKYPPNMPIDVDYRVMSTFLDFYITLLKFVNFKLYTSIGNVYPPKQTQQNTSSFYLNYEFDKIETEMENEDEKYKIDEEFALKQKQNNKKLLFSGLHFYLNTEVPRYSLEFVILAMGGTITYDYNPENHVITHVITDREKLNITQVPTKQYVQPQWVYDCVNFKKLMNVKEYWHNLKELPPHISPFYDEKDEERYIPERQKQMRGMKIDAQQPVERISQDKYDIVTQKKKAINKKKEQEKEMKKIAQNVMSNKNKKWMKVIQHGKEKKRETVNRLKDKAKKLKNK